MASQSLYRKWRSQTFSDLVGQESVIQTLKNGLNNDKLAHAYLFTGPRGTGKTSMARLLAKTINCLNPQNGEPCNVCDQCREITSGSSFNVIEIDAASNRGIDSIRELRDKVMMPPVTGKYKVYILDEAHMLTTEAFNALLKTLEEPPPHAIFVMATTDVHKMLPTVLSRCQRFDFKRFTLRQLVDRLQYVATQEHVVLEQGAAELLARAASGGMRDALSLLDQAIAYSGQSISLAQVQTMLGVADPRAIQKLIAHIAYLESPAGLHLIYELSEAGADLRQLNTQIAEYFRAMMLARAGANISEILDNTEDEVKEVKQVAQLFSLEELTECARVFAQNELMQKNLGTPQLGLELALLTCLEVHRRSGNATTRPASSVSTSLSPTPLSVSPTQLQPASPLPEAPVPSPIPQEPPAPVPPVLPPPSTPALPLQASTAALPASPTLSDLPPSPAAPLISTDDDDDDDDDEPSTDEMLPEWDSLSYPEDEEADDELVVVEPVPPVQTLEPLRIPEPDLQSMASLPPSPTPPTIPETPQLPVSAEPQSPADLLPTLTVQDVKEKWEYIKRRVRSKSMKDGPLIQALLNDYTILTIEGSQDLPVIVLRAGADFHFKQLQNNEERRKVIEWAMKVELQQECRVKLVPPGHLGSSMAIPPPPKPSDGGMGSALYSSMLAMPRRSAFQERPLQERPLSEKLSSSLSLPTPQAEAFVRSTPILAPAQDMQTVAPTLAQDMPPLVSTPARSTPPSPSLPLARIRTVRENTTGGKMHADVSNGNYQARIEQQAKGDPVVQEVVRLFKAEIKEIRPK